MSKVRSAEIWDEHWGKYGKIDVHKEIIDIVKKYSTGKQVLEVGFGTGGDLHELSKFGYKCTGLDKSRISVNKAKENKLQFKVVYGDAESMPFDDNTFDVVFHQGVLEHFKNPIKFIFEQWRVLKQGGLLVVDVPHKWNLFTIYKKFKFYRGNWYGGWERSFSANELKNLLHKNGFDILETSYYGIWPHQVGKLIYPNRIVTNLKARYILGTLPAKVLSNHFRRLYENSNFFRLINSYNLVLVARKRKLKVAVDARILESGKTGISNYVQHIYCLNSSSLEIIPISQKKLNLKNGVILLPKFHRVVWEQLFLLRLLNRLKPDIYHATSNWGIPFLYTGRSVLTIHDILPLEIEGYFSKSRNKFLAKMMYRVSLLASSVSADKIIVTTRYNLHKINGRLKLDQKKYEVIPMGVSECFFKSKGKKNSTYFLHNGGMEDRKNIITLLEGFAMYLDINKKYTLVITSGNSKSVNKFKKICAALDILSFVEFVGLVSDEVICKLVKGAKAVVYPSVDEGFGIPVLEGMAAMTPVVTSMLPNIFSFAQDIPIYVEPRSKKSIANGFEQIDIVSSKKLSEGRKIALDYRWSNILTKTKDLYYRSIFKTLE